MTNQIRLFNTLCLEINSRCNRRCSFCPVAYNTRPEERMEQGLIVKALGELGEMSYNGRIELYIYNEPMRDYDFLLDTITLARQMVPKSCLMIATNGDYLKGIDQIMEMYECGLNQLLINCYSPGLYHKRLPWVEKLPASVSRTRSVYATFSPRSRIINILDKSDPDQFGKGVFKLINRAGNIPEFLPALKEPVARMCVKPFRLLNINWRGEALVCCQDYHGDVPYGHLAESTLVELWNHPVMNSYRLKLLNKDRSLPLCRTCDCHAGAYPHLVDKNVGPGAASAASIERLYRYRVKQRQEGREDG